MRRPISITKAAVIALVAAVAVPATEMRVAAPLVATPGAPPAALVTQAATRAVTLVAAVALAVVLGAPPAAVVTLAATRAAVVTLAVAIQAITDPVMEVIKVAGTMATITARAITPEVIMARATTTEAAMETTVTAMTLTEMTVPIPVAATMGMAAMPTGPITEAAIMEAKDTAATNKRIA
ncbi:hypothetical protein N8E88_05835 (plasmid) [Phyllobacterium zundukense]|uniref:Uncharacterized protein n=1 Tax=Phyllobacterium zundukense TaxID=1867719 RepID=A0ACD4CXL3_9HYPH|nr:hypothetical protein N8E88_05835 [Phyllobacterium zundukense]